LEDGPDGPRGSPTHAAAAHERWRTVLESLGDAICLLDLDGTILLSNGSYARLVGLDGNEAAGKNCCALLHGSAGRPAACPLAKMRETRRHEEAEVCVGARWFWVGVDPVFDPGRNLIGAVHLMSDITERRRGFASLHQSEERYRHALNALPDPVFVKDEQHRWIILNDAFCRFMGYPRERLIGKSDHDFFPPQEAEVFWRKDDEVFRTERENVNEEYFTDSSGVRHTIATKKSIYSESDTGRRILVGVIRDITESKRIEDELSRYRERLEDMVRERTGELAAANERLMREASERELAEEALRESEERFRGFVENAQIGVFRITPDGRVVLANTEFATIFGFRSVEALVRERVEGLSDHGALDRSPFRTLLAQEGVVAAAEGTVTRPDGTVLPVRLYGRTIRDETGAVRFYEGTLEDLSAEKVLEEQLRHAQRMEAVGSLAGGVAHDFNNLLQAMLTHTQLLQDRSADPEGVLTVARELEEQIARGAWLTRQLLLFSRRETVKPELLDLNLAVQDATQMLRRLVRANIALEIRLESGVLPVEADRGQVEQVLMNLTVNASDAMPDGGRLVIRTGDSSNGEVWLSVADTGHGIPEGIRHRIFEPFFTTKGAGEGTGLGLSVVHGIVAQHGGRIEVDTALGSGSVFTVTLPKAMGDRLRPAESERRRPPVLAPGRGERILIVEDEAAAREGLRQILVGLGYDVVAAGSAEQAAATNGEAPFDLLLTDLMLPGLAGPELAVELQRRWPELKVILMSGYAEDEAVRLGVFSGVVRFLQKPFDMATLARELRAALAE
jgi:PAS domain S-box-containing protein